LLVSRLCLFVTSLSVLIGILVGVLVNDIEFAKLEFGMLAKLEFGVMLVTKFVRSCKLC
jgi:hypothetical protein